MTGMDFIWHYDSPLGGITLASEGTALAGLWFDGQKYFADTLARQHEERMLPVFGETIEWLDIYFGGGEPDFTPPLSMRCSVFRRDVWEVMLAIPYGKTMTYGEIAAAIARRRGLARMSAQAVGGAVGHNAISLVIPCHRVVGANGSLTGYAGGMEKKLKLLQMEHADLSGFFIPAQGTASCSIQAIWESTRPSRRRQCLRLPRPFSY